MDDPEPMDREPMDGVPPTALFDRPAPCLSIGARRHPARWRNRARAVPICHRRAAMVTPLPNGHADPPTGRLTEHIRLRNYFASRSPDGRGLSGKGADHADLMDGVAEPLARFRGILRTGPIVRPPAARHRTGGRRGRGRRRASTRVPSSAFSYPRSEPIGRADIFDLATVSLSGDTGSAGLSRRHHSTPGEYR